MTRRQTDSSILHSKAKQQQARQVQVKDYSQEVQNALNEVLQKVKAVRKDEKINIKASTTPHHDNIGVKDLNILNSFARILTGDEVCAAICNVDGTLVISTNKKSDKQDNKAAATAHINTYIGLLQKYIELPFKKDYQALESKGWEKSEKIRIKITNKLPRIEDNYYHQPYFSFIQLLGEPILPQKHHSLLAQGKKVITNYPYIKKEESREQTDFEPAPRLPAVKILRPIIDTRIIADALIDTSNKFIFDNVTKIIHQHSINNELVIILLHNIHSEMQILDAVVTQAKPGAYSIGISKLTCWPCEAIFQLFKNVPGQQITFNYTGTHAGTYHGWIEPQWLKGDYIKQFTELLKEKAGQCGNKSKDDIPYRENSISNEPILATFESISEAKKKLDELRLEKQKYNTQYKVYETVKDKVTQITKDIEVNQKKFEELSIPVTYLQEIRDYKELLKIINLEVKDCTRIDETVKALSDEKLNEVKNKFLEKGGIYNAYIKETRDYFRNNNPLSLQDKIIYMYNLYRTKSNLLTNEKLSEQALKYEAQQETRAALEAKNTELQMELNAQKGELSFQKDLFHNIDNCQIEFQGLNEAMNKFESKEYQQDLLGLDVG